MTFKNNLVRITNKLEALNKLKALDVILITKPQ